MAKPVKYPKRKVDLGKQARREKKDNKYRGRHRDDD